MFNDEIKKMIEDSKSLAIVKEALTLAAKLNYTEKGLMFSDETIDTLFKIVFPETRQETFERLKAEKAAEEDF